MFIYGIKINNDNTTIPKDYVKLFISYKNYKVILEEHISIHKTEDINIFHTKDKFFLSNFDKLIYMFEKHPELSNFYYYPFGNIEEILEDFKKILLKIRSPTISLEEITSKSIYQKLDTLIKKYMVLSKYNKNDIYNPCFKDFENYICDKEYTDIPKEYVKIIKKLSDMNNCVWKDDLLELNDCLYNNKVTMKYKFNYCKNTNDKPYIFFYKFVNDKNENIFQIISENILILSEYPEIKILQCFYYITNVLEQNVYNKIYSYYKVKFDEISLKPIEIYFDYFYYTVYDNYIQDYIRYHNFKQTFIKFIRCVNNNFVDYITSNKLKKICISKNIEFKRKNNGFYIKSKK